MGKIYVGTGALKQLYIGTSKVKKIYQDAAMIWQSAIPIARPTSAQLNPSATYNGSTISNGFSMTGVEFVSGATSGTNAGVYIAYYQPDAEHIWEDTEDRAQVAVTLTINKAAGTASGGYNLSPTYNGTEQNLIAGCIGTGTIEYSIDQSYWYTETPSATNVSSYNIYYRARESANYTASAVVGPVWCNLNRASVGGKPSSIPLVYNGNYQAPYSIPGGVAYSGTTSAVNSGNYTSSYWPDGNHCWSDGGTETVTVNWAIDYKVTFAGGNAMYYLCEYTSISITTWLSCGLYNNSVSCDYQEEEIDEEWEEGGRCSGAYYTSGTTICPAGSTLTVGAEGAITIGGDEIRDKTIAINNVVVAQTTEEWDLAYTFIPTQNIYLTGPTYTGRVYSVAIPYAITLTSGV